MKRNIPASTNGAAFTCRRRLSMLGRRSSRMKRGGPAVYPAAKSAKPATIFASRACTAQLCTAELLMMFRSGRTRGRPPPRRARTGLARVNKFHRSRPSQPSPLCGGPQRSALTSNGKSTVRCPPDGAAPAGPARARGRYVVRRACAASTAGWRVLHVAARGCTRQGVRTGRRFAAASRATADRADTRQCHVGRRGRPRGGRV